MLCNHEEFVILLGFFSINTILLSPFPKRNSQINIAYNIDFYYWYRIKNFVTVQKTYLQIVAVLWVHIKNVS